MYKGRWYSQHVQSRCEGMGSSEGLAGCEGPLQGGSIGPTCWRAMLREPNVGEEVWVRAASRV